MRDHGWKRMLAILAVLVLALVLVSLAAGGRLSRSASGPAGTIFVSGASDANVSFLETFTVYLSDGSQKHIGEDNESLGDFYSFSRDGRAVAFIGVTKTRLDAAAAHQASIGSIMQVALAKT